MNCAFGNELAVTEIEPLDLPDKGLIFPQNDSVRCTDPNCFTQSIQYNPSLAQIEVGQLSYIFRIIIDSYA